MNNYPLSEPELLSPDELTIHPDLAGFPGLSDDQSAALHESIKTHGVQEPLLADQHRQVYSGRARLLAAQALGIEKVSVIVRPEDDVLGFAIENAVARRQLTKSAIAVVLFEQHPTLATSGGAKPGRQKKCGINPHLIATAESYRQLAIRYRISAKYFTYVADIRAKATDEEWETIRHLVLFEEASLPRQWAGLCTGLKAGTARGPVVYAAVDEQGLLEGILPTAFASVRQGFARWRTGEIQSAAKAAVEREWETLLDEAPPELLRIAARKGRK